MEKLYEHTESVHNTRAAEIVVPIILKHFSANSVLDIGCGTGTWLKIFKDKHEVSDIVGLDGDYLNKEQLVIDTSFFIETDLRKAFDLKRSFDLAICLEVAEHIPKDSAETLIGSICKHAEIVIFSAAIPGQGGQNHINEQWPKYWEEKFNSFGYKKFDTIRSEIWENEQVDLWYRQNIFVYSKLDLGKSQEKTILEAQIHPNFWEAKVKSNEKLNSTINDLHYGRISLKTGLKIFVRSLLNVVKK